MKNNNKSTLNKIDFKKVKTALSGHENKILQRILPGGKQRGTQYVVLNPTRADTTAKSFKINTENWLWSDFATGDKGGDIISLYAYVKGMSQIKAAKELLAMVGRAA